MGEEKREEEEWEEVGGLFAVSLLAGTGTGPHYTFPGRFCRWSRDEPMLEGKWEVYSITC